MSTLRISDKSEVLAERRFYDDTYLKGDDGLMVFVLDAALVRGPSGKEQLRTHRDVVLYPDLEALAASMAMGNWQEAPLEEDRHWRPTVDQLIPSGWLTEDSPECEDR